MNGNQRARVGVRLTHRALRSIVVDVAPGQSLRLALQRRQHGERAVKIETYRRDFHRCLRCTRLDRTALTLKQNWQCRGARQTLSRLDYLVSRIAHFECFCEKHRTGWTFGLRLASSVRLCHPSSSDFLLSSRNVYLRRSVACCLGWSLSFAIARASGELFGDIIN
jgi:hypothetical protein